MLVDPLVELGLQLFLGHTHQEVPDQLGNGLSNRADDNLEVGVDTSTDLLDEDVCTATRARRNVLIVRPLVLRVLRLDQVAVLIVLGHALLLRHN